MIKWRITLRKKHFREENLRLQRKAIEQEETRN